MIRLSIVTLLSLSACSATSPPIDTDPPVITTSTTSSTTTVPPKYSDEGSVVLLVQHPDAVNDTSRVTVSAVFAEDRRGYVNLAQCVSAPGSWCAPDLPTVEDDYVLVDAFNDTITENLRTLSVGPTIDFAGYAIASQDLGGHTVYYANDLFSQGLPSGALDLSFNGGDWGDFSGTAVDGTPGTLVVSAPDPLRDTGHVAGRDIEVRWNGGGNGEVYLAVLTPGERRLYLLGDDGEFDLDISSLPLTDGDPLDLVLGRWTTNTLDQEGNDIRIEAHDEQWMHGTYRDLGGRTEIVPEDNCLAAQNMAPLVPGNYFGDITTYANSTNPGTSGCTGDRATGQDGLLRVVLPDQTRFEANLGYISDDASMYLVSQCGITQSCLTGSDSTFGAGSIETLTYFNDSGAEQDLFLVIDSYDGSTDLFQLDITQTTLQLNLLVDTCADALLMPFTPNGVFLGALGGFQNYLDPTCSPAPGPEGLAKFELQAGETLNATVTIPGANPALYVLYNCAIGDSCAQGSDVSAASNESLIYTNTTAASEIIYLAVDSASNSGAYTLDVLVQ